VLLVLVVVLAVTTCSSGSGSGAGADARAAAGERLTVKLGQTTTIGKVDVVVTALGPVDVPVLPASVADTGDPPGLGADQSFYQAFVRLKNGGDAPVRVDPVDFWLADGEKLLPADGSRSGPIARSLLHGATINEIVTFRAPAGLKPELVYRPSWSARPVVVEGDLLPVGMTTPGTESGGSQ
jgi:Domain of unknown function (DUF4352)